jgi:predicted ATPase
MISLIEALNFRCLHYLRRPLDRFHILVGPNASGKTTFLDVIWFLRDLAGKGVQSAVAVRTANFFDLVWKHADTGFELAVELELPDDLRDASLGASFDTVRYEVAIRLDRSTNRIEIPAEQAFLKPRSQTLESPAEPVRNTVFQRTDLADDAFLSPECLFAKYRGCDGQLHGQVRLAPTISTNAFGSRDSFFGSLPTTGNLLGTWLRDQLEQHAVSIALDQKSLRLPAPPGMGTGLDTEGSNLPWVVHHFATKSPTRFQAWLAHLRTALPDLVNVTTTELPEDRRRYVSLVYGDGLTVPSWMASDGTLRLLALTLPAYLEATRGIYLIEEPENGVHPMAIETMHQSLSSVYDAQVLLATHSPVLLSIANPKDVLCFAKTAEGATDIVSGDRHPRLRDWQGEVDLGTLFASGVLG